MPRFPLVWRFGLALSLAACSSQESHSGYQLGTAREPIVGGTPDTTSKGVVALTDRIDGEDLGFCSGSLLAPNVVLTARHCVSEIVDEVDGGVDCSVTKFGALFDYGVMHVSIEDDITTGADPSLLFGIQQVHLPAGDAVCGADIAVLVLSGQGVPDSLAKAYAPSVNASPVESAAFMAVGYGITDPKDEYGTTFGRRMRYEGASVYCVGHDACDGYGEDREWIGDAATCSGDSGGPAIDAQQQVTGVLSRGDDLCSFAVYTDVYHFAPLLRKAASDAATLGGYAPAAWVTAGPVDQDAGPQPEPEPEPEPDGGTSGNGGADAGSPQPGGNGVGGSGTPGVDALGVSCNGDCPGSYACYAADSKPPGICVPFCGEGLPACPGDYTCSSTLGACVPEQHRDEGGCSVASPQRDGAPPFTWALLAASVLAASRRRRARRALVH